MTLRHAYWILALSLALTIPGCGDSDPQSPASPSSISGTVVYDQTGSPAASVDVILERESGSMMMGDHWNQAGHMMTNSHGQFHFEYMHDPEHHYRVGVMGMAERHTCDGDGGSEDGVVLRIHSQDP